MKKIFIFLIVLLPFLAKSQTVITGKYKYTDSLTFAKYKNNSTLDSVLSVDQNGRLRLAPRTGLDTTSLSNRIDARVKYTDTANMLIPYLRKLDTTGKWLSVGYLPYLVKYSDTAAFLSAYYNKTAIDAKLALKLNISDTANMLSPYARTSNLPSLAPYVKYTDTASMLSSYYNKTATDAKLALKLNISDTANMLSSYYNKTATDSKLALKLNISDTANMLSPYARTLALGGYIPYTGATSAIDLNAKTVVNISHLGINTTTVPTILLRAIGDNSSLSRIAMRGYSSDANSSSIRVTKFRGTAASPQAPLSGDGLGKFELAGYGTTSSDGYPQASFEGIATENWGATARGAKVQIKITPNTTITQAVALTINQDKSAVFENSITGTSLIKTGGTSLQFLKADGSVDANSYMNISDTATMLTPYLRSTNYGLLKSGQIVSADSSLLSTKLWRQTGIDSVAALDAQKVKYTDTATMLSAYYNKTATDAKVNLKVNISDTATMLSAYYNKTATDSKFALKVNISDTEAMLSGYKTYYPRAALSFTAGSGAYNNSTGVITIPTNTNQLTNGAGFITGYTETDPIVKAINGIVKSNGTTISAASAGTDYQAPISLTTTGSSGASTFVSNTLNVPAYTLAGLGGQPQLNGTGFVKASGTTISYDNSTYLTTSAAASTYLPLTGGTLSGTLNGTNGNFSQGLSVTGDLNIPIGIKDNTIGLTGTTGYTTIGGNSTSFSFLNYAKGAKFIYGSSSVVNYTLPSSNGTIALTSDIPSLSGYVQGTGTTNYLPKFTGTSTIGNSLLYESVAGNIIIGYAGTDDGNKFQLYTDSQVGFDRRGSNVNVISNFMLNQNSSTALEIGIGGTTGYTIANWANNAFIESAKGLVLGAYASDGIYFQLGRVSKMTLTAAGRLLLGTTTESTYLLDVNGTGRVLSGLYVQASSNSDLPFINFSNNGGVYNWGRIGGLLQGDGDGSLYFQTKLGGALGTRLTIASTGAATFSSTIQTGSGPTMKFVQKFAGTPAMTGNVLSVSIDGTTYYIQLYNTTL